MSQTENMKKYYSDIIETIKNSGKSDKRKKFECDTYRRMADEDFHYGKRLTDEEYDEIVEGFNEILNGLNL